MSSHLLITAPIMQRAKWQCECMGECGTDHSQYHASGRCGVPDGHRIARFGKDKPLWISIRADGTAKKTDRRWNPAFKVETATVVVVPIGRYLLRLQGHGPSDLLAMCNLCRQRLADGYVSPTSAQLELFA